MKYDYIYDSTRQIYEEKLEFEGETKPSVTVLFSEEGVVLQADNNGNAIFFDLEGYELYKARAEYEGKAFRWIYFHVSKNTLSVSFTVTKLVDNYPHCDGEYDRWDEIVVKKIPITYTL